MKKVLFAVGGISLGSKVCLEAVKYDSGATLFFGLGFSCFFCAA